MDRMRRDTSPALVRTYHQGETGRGYAITMNCPVTTLELRTSKTQSLSLYYYTWYDEGHTGVGRVDGGVCDSANSVGDGAY